MFVSHVRGVWVLVAFGILLANLPARAQDKKERTLAELRSPKPDSVVKEVDEIDGKLTTPGGYPVLFIKPLVDGGVWWIQPAPETAADGSFSGVAYFGDQHTPRTTGFFLVLGVLKSKEEAARFKRGETLPTLPADLPTLPAVRVYRDERPPPPPNVRTVGFADRTWLVKTGARVGPGPNDFSDATENVWVDPSTGYLHLAITKTGDRWKCAEVVANRSLGYGEYQWSLASDFSALDIQTVLGLFTYETTRKEIDFELSRWGTPNKPNAQFVVQPYTAKNSTYRFDTGKATVLTCSLLWAKDKIRGRCWEGTDASEQPLADWTYTGPNIPPPGKERVRANLWLFDGKPAASGTRQEVVIRSFQFRTIDSLKD